MELNISTIKACALPTDVSDICAVSDFTFFPTFIQSKTEKLNLTFGPGRPTPSRPGSPGSPGRPVGP